MMIEIKAPDDSKFESFTKMFLAGSIEMGSAEKWQERLTKELKDEKIIAFNPRRDDWDSSWVQDPTPNTPFHQQVNWELDHIKRSDLVVFYFDPNTKSPITLMELGYCIGLKKNIVVCCPEDFYRYGNVVIMCRLVGVTPVHTFDEFVVKIRGKLPKKESIIVEMSTTHNDDIIRENELHVHEK
jgi:hypothetical protein